MNLRGLVNRAVQGVNPDLPITWQSSQGYSTDPASGVSTPNYITQTVYGQVQPLPTQRLAHLAELNIQGVLRSVFVRGTVLTAVRVDGTGGDLLQFPEIPGAPTRTWLVVLVDEQWPDWCRATVQLQND